MNNAKSERVIEIDSRKSTKHEEKYEIDCRRTPRFAIGDVDLFTAEEAPAYIER